MGQRVEAKRRGSRSGGSLPSWLLPVGGGVILGLLLGLVIGWNTVTFSVNPSGLNLGGQRAWVEMVADSLAVSDDSALAQRRMLGPSGGTGFFTPEQAASLVADRITAAEGVGDLSKAQRLRQLGTALGVDPTTAAPLGESGGGATNMLGTVLTWCGGGLLLLVLVGGGALLATRLRQGGTTPARARASSSRNKATVGTPPSPRKPPAERNDLVIPDRPGRLDDDADDDSSSALDRLFDDTADAVEQATFEPTREVDFAEPDLAPVRYSPALDEFITRYNYGDDGFDMSFSIETPQVEFLGECGVGISDTVNEGTPQQVTAFEVWLFDKDDIRTVTKVLLSDHAWNNEELRSRLGPKGELIHARAGETVDLETKSLRVRARIREVEYGSSGSDNAYFERLVVELTPQQKQ